MALLATGGGSQGHRVLHFHGAVVDLRQVVVFDRARCGRCLCVNDGRRADESTKLVRIKGRTNDRSTLAEELLEVGHGDDARVDVAHFDLALGQSALDHIYLGGLLLQVGLLIVHNRSLWLALTQGSISVLLSIVSSI